MKVAIIFSNGMKQINFTPENDDEKQALKLITPNDDIDLAVKIGSFGDEKFRNLGIEINQCQGGYLRAFSNEESVMLVLSPKDKKEVIKQGVDAKQTAIEFVKNLGDDRFKLFSEDYEQGFTEGVEKYIESKQNK